MFAQFKTLPQLFDYFKDEKVCMAYWEQVRWNGNVTCPHCNAGNPYKTNRGYKCRNIECQKKFSPLVKSIFENTNLPLRTWFAAIFLCCNHKKGISSLQVSRDLGIHQKSAWFLLHRIREMIREINPNTLGGDGVIVEADSTIVGGKVKNMTKSKRRAIREDGPSRNDNKTVVSAYVERGGKVRFDVLDPHETERDLVVKHVDKGSVLMTDTGVSYKSAGKEFAAHEMVNHQMDEYVRGNCHTNTIEGAFSLFDRMVIGIYHFISRKHMQAYCNEVAYRYNTRKMNITQRFEDAVMKCAGVRLKYAGLTA